MPTSSNHYGNLTQANIGEIVDELIVAPNSAGVGGEASINIGNGVQLTADMTIHKANYFGVQAELTGNVQINELAGALDVGGISGQITITKATGTQQQFGRLRIFSAITGSVTVNEIATDRFFVFNPEGIAASGRMTLGHYTVSTPPLLFETPIEIGSWGGNPALGHYFDGTLEFLGDVPWVVYLTPVTGPTSTINFNGGDVTGELHVFGGGSGNIINGGDVTGIVSLGSVYQSQSFPFAGTASFASVGSTGIVKTGDSTPLNGDIEITGTTTPMNGQIQVGDAANTANIGTGGLISVSSQLGTGSAVTVYGNVSSGGRVSVSGGMVTGSNLKVKGQLDGVVEVLGASNQMNGAVELGTQAMPTNVTQTGLLAIEPAIGSANGVHVWGGVNNGGRVQLKKGLLSMSSAIIGGDVVGTVEIGAPAVFGGDVAGTLSLGGSLSGTISHFGTTSSTGAIELGPVLTAGRYTQSHNNSLAQWEGSLTVNGDLSGIVFFKTKLQNADVVVEGAMSGKLETGAMYDSSIAINTLNYCYDSTSGLIQIGNKFTAWVPTEGTGIVNLGDIDIWGDFTSTAWLKISNYQITEPISAFGTVCYHRHNYGHEQVFVTQGTPPAILHCPATQGDPCDPEE